MTQRLSNRIGPCVCLSSKEAKAPWQDLGLISCELMQPCSLLGAGAHVATSLSIPSACSEQHNELLQAPAAPRVLCFFTACACLLCLGIVGLRAWGFPDSLQRVSQQKCHESGIKQLSWHVRVPLVQAGCSHLLIQVVKSKMGFCGWL